MVSEARLTDEVIDSLSGRELDEAVALASGWRVIRGVERDYWLNPNSANAYGAPSNDIGAAMLLLLTLPTQGHGWAIDCHTEFGESDEEDFHEVFEVYSEVEGRPLASGPKSVAAQTICQAFLKLKRGVKNV